MGDVFQGPILFLAVGQISLAWALHPRRVKGLHPAVRVVLFLALTAAVLLIDNAVVDFNNATTALESPLCFAAAVIFLCIGWCVPWHEAFYCAVCSFFMTELLTQAYLPALSALTAQMGYVAALALRLALHAAVVSAVCGGIAHWVVPRLQDEGAYGVDLRKLVFSLLIWCIYLLAANYQFIFWLLGYEPEGTSTIITVFRLVVGSVCLCLLFLQRSMEQWLTAERELAVERELWLRRQNQFEMSQVNIDLINRKCHDLKRQMEAIRRLKDEGAIDRQLRELEQAVLLYDSAIHTGNQALDVILTEKNLACEAHHITMTCMVEGRELERLDSVDLYTMFGLYL